ncbi:NADP-dependent 3-hydroxy acid dehydrogenase YdfG [Jatrophihabitans endophyticus]|uniref:NADP-dependent 3-hydroxy acid dehydrogenase YdfG n=2 Tax=Jatrophihabitans endophyticus TaxID=1206085 RepID=A0A1M5KVI7_9ACTN|nr:NADP-dependent 3-hydroxy acid dehydrogenase YdfG [Jatrophihabitans endophyticus]
MTTALVIGGTSGIGEATARELRRLGADSWVVGRDADRLAAALARLGDGVHGEALDAADATAMRALGERIGPIDVLVLAASGARGGGPFAELSLDELRAGLDAKLLVQLAALQALLPSLATAASVVFVSAGSARAALPGTAGLAAINGAVQAVVGPLASELAPVRVNAVSPGVIDTPWWNGQGDGVREAVFERFSAALPVGRVGRAEEVAALIAAVATNGFVTGSVVDCAGGGQLARS